MTTGTLDRHAHGRKTIGPESDEAEWKLAFPTTEDDEARLSMLYAMWDSWDVPPERIG
jgi:hypothetical protein